MIDSVKVTVDFFKNGICDAVDTLASERNTTRHKAAVDIFKAALGGDISVSFDDKNMIVEFPKFFFDASREAGKDEETIIRDCVTNGMLKLQA